MVVLVGVVGCARMAHTWKSGLERGEVAPPRQPPPEPPWVVVISCALSFAAGRSLSSLGEVDRAVEAVAGVVTVAGPDGTCVSEPDGSDVSWAVILIRDDGLGDPEPADWQLAPDAPVGPATRSVPVLVHERECASGRSAEGRIRAEVEHRSDAVTISIGVRPFSIGTCPGNPITPHTVDLGEPLGDREILGQTGLP